MVLATNVQGVRRSTALLVDRVARICRSQLLDRELRVSILDELRRALGFDAYAWLLTDPTTWVGSGPLAEVPNLAELPRLIALKYCTSVNRWTGLPARRGALLSVATDGRLSMSLMWRELLSGYGVVDVASISLRDRYGSWGFLDLWRLGSGSAYDKADAELLTRMGSSLTTGLRQAQARLFAAAASPPVVGPGPAVLVLDDQLRILQQTASVEQHLRALLPTAPDLSPVPAAALNVAAQLLAVEAGVDDHAPSARAHLAGGPWIGVRASRLHSATDGQPGTIAVTIEPLPAHERLDLYARATGLTQRERQILHEVAQGADNAALGLSLNISRFTVQDHLKSIFGKTGCRSRAELIARATGGHH